MESYSDRKESITFPTPGDDFYQHVNGRWLETVQIPPSEAIWGSFPIARDRTVGQLREIAASLRDDGEFDKGSPEQQTRDFYLSGMDMATRDSLGLEPLDELRRIICDVTDDKSALSAMASLRLRGTGTFFGLGIGEDDKRAGSYALFIGQGGLGLPDRDYYLKDDEKMQVIQQKYKNYISTTFQMLGIPEDQANSTAQGVYDIEYALAEASKPEDEARPIDENYTKFTLAEAKQEFSDIPWDAYFDTLGKPDIKDFVIQQPEFIKKVGEILQNENQQPIKDYLEFRLLQSKGSSLGQDFKTESFKFNGQVLSGLKEPQPLWKTTVGVMDSTLLTNAIGSLYCKENFDLRDKAESEIMVEDVRQAALDRIKALDWMTQKTKKLMLKKVDNIIFKMGFPEEWIDVSTVDIQPDTYLDNLMRLSEFSLKRKLARLEEPFDYSEWLMNPTAVNACSDLKREMTFPAAIHQPPFYDTSQDYAYNYGALGGVIGHELTHFIDDEGCKYDLDGNVNDWWTPQDKKRFKQKTQKFVDYYSSLESDGMKVNGKLTLGENIADVGGITIAYYALQRRLERDSNHSTIDDLTPEQRLFTGWARVWAKKMTPELAQQRILTDPHSPGEVRTNGVLAIVPEFYEAFNVVEGDKMYIDPKDRPTLW